MPRLIQSPLQLFLFGSLALALAACELNPQPEPPADEETGGTGNISSETGGEGAGLGGLSTGGAIVRPTGGVGAAPTGGASTGGTSAGSGGLAATGGAGVTGGASASGGLPATGGGGSGATGTGGAAPTGGRGPTGGASTGGETTGGVGTGTGGTDWGTGGAGVTGGSGSSAGGAGNAGGAGGAPGPWCAGTADTTLVDDAADCDAIVVLTRDRSGVWFAYDSSPQLPGSLFPSPGTFQMTDTGGGNDCAARASGSGYPFSETDGYGYAGIGLALQTPYGETCPTGYDAKLYAGLSFEARGTGSIRVLVETMATAGEDRPNGYVEEFALTGDWAVYTLTWNDLELFDVSSGAAAAIDATRLRTIRFEPVWPTAFDFWIDNVAFTLRAGGAGGAGGESPGDGSPGGAAGSGI